MKIGYLGPKNTFSNEAALKLKKQIQEKNGIEAEIEEYADIESVIKSIAEGKIDKAVVPTMQSTNGDIWKHIKLLYNYIAGLKKVGEIKIDVNQCLLANPGVQLSHIKEIYSHPQAFGQCAGFLSQYPNIIQHETESTALAAQMIVGELQKACIASKLCVEFGLDVLAENIQDNKDNNTIFSVIEDAKVIIFPTEDIELYKKPEGEEK